MIGLALLAVAQAASAQQAPIDEAKVAEHLAAIETRMSAWDGGLTKRDGQVVCQTVTSSGDEAADAIRCAAMLQCYAPYTARLDAIAASDAPIEERRTQMQAIGEQAAPCIATAGAQAAQRLAEYRAAR